LTAFVFLSYTLAVRGRWPCRGILMETATPSLIEVEHLAEVLKKREEDPALRSALPEDLPGELDRYV